MKVRDLMKKEFTCLSPDNTYKEAVALVCKAGVSGLPVVGADKKIVGYVSEKDLFRILFPYYKSYYSYPESYTNGEARETKAAEIEFHKVADFMNKAPLTISPDAPVMNAAALMIANRMHQFPVVEDGNVVGLISRETIYKEIFKKNFKDIFFN